MQKAIGYIRVSTDQQAEEGVSLDAQKARISAWCAANDYELVAVFDDAVSGGAEIDKRRGLLLALDAVKAHKAVALVVFKRDRLARDVMNAAMIERLVSKVGAKVVATDGGGNGDAPEDFLLRGIQDVFAQYERMLIRFRTKAALAHKKANNEKYAPVPFGYREALDKRLEVVAAEADLVAQIVKQRESGRTLQAIANDMNQRGVVGKQGGKWYPSTVKVILARKAA